MEIKIYYPLGYKKTAFHDVPQIASFLGRKAAVLGDLLKDSGLKDYLHNMNININLDGGAALDNGYLISIDLVFWIMLYYAYHNNEGAIDFLALGYHSFYDLLQQNDQ